MNEDKKELINILTENIKTMDNKELIEDFKLFSDYCIHIIEEFYLRYQSESDLVTDEELKRFKGIGDLLILNFKTRF